jgi:hypothetical protein
VQDEEKHIDFVSHQKLSCDMTKNQTHNEPIMDRNAIGKVI